MLMVTPSGVLVVVTIRTSYSVGVTTQHTTVSMGPEVLGYTITEYA